MYKIIINIIKISFIRIGNIPILFYYNYYNYRIADWKERRRRRRRRKKKEEEEEERRRRKKKKEEKGV